MFDCQTSNDRYNFNSQGVRVDGDVIYLEDILDPGGVYGVTGKEKLVSKLLLSILQNSSYEPFSEEKRPLELHCESVVGRQPTRDRGHAHSGDRMTRRQVGLRSKNNGKYMETGLKDDSEHAVQRNLVQVRPARPLPGAIHGYNIPSPALRLFRGLGGAGDQGGHWRRLLQDREGALLLRGLRLRALLGR